MVFCGTRRFRLRFVFNWVALPHNGPLSGESTVVQMVGVNPEPPLHIPI
jgi:hypothetical protein